MLFNVDKKYFKLKIKIYEDKAKYDFPIYIFDSAGVELQQETVDFNAFIGEYFLTIGRSFNFKEIFPHLRVDSEKDFRRELTF